MGRIVVKATVENGTDPSCRIVCDVLVDTGAAYLTLPSAWRPRLGELAVYADAEDDICATSRVAYRLLEEVAEQSSKLPAPAAGAVTEDSPER